MDELFLFNWIMDLLVLILTALFFRSAGGRRWKRLFFGAVCGAAGSCVFSALQLVYGCKWLAEGPAALLAGVLLSFGMAAVALPAHTVGGLVLRTVAVYMSALLIGGVCDWLRAYMGGAYLLWLAAAAIVCAACRLYLVRRRAHAPACVNARILCGGAVVSAKGMVDTGNSLTLPGTRTPVSVIWEKALLPALTGEQLCAYQALCAELYGKEGKFATAAHGEKATPIPEPGNADERGWRLVPYTSVGRSLGVLPALCVAHIYVRTEMQEHHLEQVWLAVSPQPLASRGGCVMLWHPAHMPGYSPLETPFDA